LAWVATTVQETNAQPVNSNRINSLALSLEGTAELQVQSAAVDSIFLPYYSTFVLEKSTGLVDWTRVRYEVIINQTATAGLFTITDDSAPASQRRFYRTQAKSLITPFVAPAGPYSVGRRRLLITDTNRASATLPGEDHQIVITIWHPTPPQPGQVPMEYVEPGVATTWEFYRGDTNLVGEFTSHAFDSPPVVDGPFPVVLLSPGLWGHRKENTGLAQELTSHGYIVVGMDHEDTELSIQPDGRTVMGTHPPLTTPNAIATINERREDFENVLNSLELINANDPVLAGNLELTAVGSIGFSLGGSAALKFCSQDNRCLAVVAMDGTIFDPVLQQLVLGKPLLFVRAQGADPEYTGDDRKAFFDLQQSPAWWLKFNYAVHPSFIDAQLISQALAPLPVGREIHRVRNQYIVSFLNRFLKQENDGLLDAAPTSPVVMTLLEK
jgi:dienelactone hydrolase